MPLHNFAPTYTTADLRKFEKQLTDSVLPKIAANLGQHYLVHFSRDTNGNPELKLISKPNGSAYLSINKNPDGTLHTPPGQEHQPLTADKTVHITRFTNQLIQQVTQSALSDRNIRRTITGIIAQGSDSSLTYRLSDTARHIATTALRLSVLPSKKDHFTTKHVNTLWNRLIRSHFTDPYIANLTSTTLHQQHNNTTPSQYNLFLRNADTITRYSNDEKFKTLLTFFVRKLIHLNPEATFQDPHQLTALITDLLHIPPHLGRHLHLATTHPYTITRPTTQVLAVCKALDLLPADTDPAKLQHVAAIRLHHERFFQAAGTIWDQWTHAIRRYPYDQGNTNLDSSADHLLQQITPPEQTAPNQDTPFPTPLSNLTDYILDQGLTAVAGSFPTWTPTVATQTENTRTLKVIVDPKGNAAHTIRRNADGTITVRSKSHPNHLNTYLYRPQLTQLLTNNIAHKLLEKAATAFPNDFAQTIAFSYINKLATSARAVATQIAAAKVTTHDPDDYRHLVTKVNNAIRTHVLHNETERLAISLFQREKHSNRSDQPLHHYNTVALNLPMFRQMVETGQQAPLTYQCTHLSPHPAPRKYRHPGEIITEVKQAINFTNKEWRYFCKAAYVTANHTPKSHHLQQLATACRALADANRPNADPLIMRTIVDRDRDHQFFSQAHWPQGNPWKAWVSVINAYMTLPRNPPDEYDLGYIVDALRYHVQHQLPWGSGDWQTLLARAERWHRQYLQDLNLDLHPMTPEGLRSTWDSTIQDIEIGGFRFNALTTGADLAETGRVMGNCLASYWIQCLRGESRVFTATSGKQPTAAVQVSQQYGSWKAVQLESARRAPIPDGLRSAASRLASAYDLADKLRLQQEEETAQPEPNQPTFTS